MASAGFGLLPVHWGSKTHGGEPRSGERRARGESKPFRLGRTPAHGRAGRKAHQGRFGESSYAWLLMYSSALSNRLRLTSRPSSSSVASMGGDTPPPETATRKG